MGMRFVLFVQRILGRNICFLLMLPVTLFYFCLRPSARFASKEYLKNLTEYFPDLQLKANTLTSFMHFLAFTSAILDKLAIWNQKITIKDVTVVGRETFLNMAKERQGAVILASHLGNIEVARALISLSQHRKLNVLMHTKNSKAFSKLIEDLSGDSQVQLLEVTEVGPAMAILLEQKIELGELVCIVGDMVPVSGEGRTVDCEFLGKKAKFAQGPIILASLLACPVFTLFCVKIDKRYHIYFEHFADRVLLKRQQRQAMIQEYAQQFAFRLELYCKKAPLQWFNFYKYWQ